MAVLRSRAATEDVVQVHEVGVILSGVHEGVDSRGRGDAQLSGAHHLVQRSQAEGVAGILQSFGPVPLEGRHPLPGTPVRPEPGKEFGPSAGRGRRLLSPPQPLRP